MTTDMIIVTHWWISLFIVGIAGFPLSHKIFSSWFDHGYFLSKAVGLVFTTFFVYLLSVLHIFPFGLTSIVVVLSLFFAFSYFAFPVKKINYKQIVIEELFFIIALALWCWVKAHEPSIHGLEKFMDFGFTKSILNTSFFPAPDMWFAGKFYINYYYFGHTMLAMLTKLSSIDLAYTFNLMLATLFAFTSTMSFALIYQITKKISFSALGSFIVTLGGNLQTIYAFTKGYTGDYPPPFWQIFTGKFDPNYWYANATRFIPFTIHEFPSYSFVVSDVHGHVLSLPLVLLALGMIIEIFWNRKHSLWTAAIYGFLGATLLMTNALDGPIYMGLFFVLTIFSNQGLREKIKTLIVASVATIVTALPFMFYFKSFVSGLAVNCPPAFLAGTKIGPLLFESVEKCQKSPIWMMMLLWGFFLYCGLWLFSKYKVRDQQFMFVLFMFSVALIIFPEFFYFKDIYPQHFRSNTMFKLGYQAFIMFGIVSAFTISKIRDKAFWIGLLPLLMLVMIFPYFSVKSYFGNLEKYHGLNGLTWLNQQYPDDYNAIVWINSNVSPSAVLVEADGDSYTDYERFSTFTGRQTIVGWAVHEWLWRGSYDVVAPRREEVRQIYESPDLGATKDILNKYQVNIVVVGTLEREKFKQLNEAKIATLGEQIFKSGDTVLYRVK